MRKWMLRVVLLCLILYLSISVSGESEPVIRPLRVSGRADITFARTGEPITIQGSARGGDGDYLYSYLLHNRDTDEWKRFTYFGEADEFIWTSESGGAYDFYVEARDGSGVPVRASGIPVIVIDDALELDSWPDRSDVCSKETVRIDAVGRGGTGHYRFRFLAYNCDTGNWQRLTEFSEDCTYYWKAETAGSWMLFAEVKDSSQMTLRSQAMEVVVTE